MIAEHHQPYTKHGGSRWGIWSPEFRSYKNMRMRVLNARHPRYGDYGGRGIRICSHWMISFANFLRDMGQKPSPEYHIDRIDNDGHYSCGHCEECLRNGWSANCRWSTPANNAINRRGNIWITLGDITLSLAEWSRTTGLKSGTIRARLRAGWPIAKVLAVPAVYGNRIKIRRRRIQMAAIGD